MLLRIRTVRRSACRHVILMIFLCRYFAYGNEILFTTAWIFYKIENSICISTISLWADTKEFVILVKRYKSYTKLIFKPYYNVFVFSDIWGTACCSFRPRYLIDEYSYFLSWLSVFLNPYFTLGSNILGRKLYSVVGVTIAPWRHR